MQLQTSISGYRELRASAIQDTAITLETGGAFRDKPSTAIQVVSNATNGAGGFTNINALQIIFAGGFDGLTDPDDHTFTWRLYAYRDEGCPAEYVANGTGVLGSQDVIDFPDGTPVSPADSRNWCDTITISEQRFPTTLVTTAAAGGNEIAKLLVDAAGYKWWYCEITDADGATGAEAGPVSAWYAGF